MWYSRVCGYEIRSVVTPQMSMLGAHPSWIGTKSACFQEFLSPSVFALSLTERLCIPNVPWSPGVTLGRVRVGPAVPQSWNRSLWQQLRRLCLCWRWMSASRGGSNTSRWPPALPSLRASWETPVASDQPLWRRRVRQSCWVSVTQSVLAPQPTFPEGTASRRLRGGTHQAPHPTSLEPLLLRIPGSVYQRVHS